LAIGAVATKLRKASPQLINACPLVLLLLSRIVQVNPNGGGPTIVNTNDYIHLHDTGYAGGWGWAWYNVTESFNYATGQATGRGIGEHKCRGSLRALLKSLPQRLRYPVKQSVGTGPQTLSNATAAAAAAVAAVAAQQPGTVPQRNPTSPAPVAPAASGRR
jgi:hypothetical protein